jgi:ATP-binding protein involved in chromosome partitioning
MSDVSEAAVRTAVERVVDPEFGRTLSEARLLDRVHVAQNKITVDVALPTHAYAARETLRERIQQAVRQAAPNCEPAAVTFRVVTRGKESGGALGLRVKNVVAVGSGKGGVGKSTIAASLAYGLRLLGAEVGLMDADVYGPSIPHMLGLRGQPTARELTGSDGKPFRRIVPLETLGMKVMSMGFFVPPDEAVVWRGPMLHGAITQFLKDTDWGELDYLIIDLPPGTGDVSLTLSQLLGLAGAVVVCTPQPLALLDAVKALNMFRKVKIPVLGIVENMSGDVFGRGGARKKAEELGVPFLGELPMDPQVRINEDEGRLADNFAANSASRTPLEAICRATAMQIAKEMLAAPALPTLEIL